MNLEDLILPYDSAQFVVENAKSVSVCQDGVENLSHKVSYQ